MLSSVSKLREEIKQTKPFESLESEVTLNLFRTAEAVGRAAVALMKRAGFTDPQYNVLRILRGAGPNGLMCAEIGERMVTHDPDVTRLLDRLEKRDLIRRTREQSDRRVVTARITQAGLEELAKLDAPLETTQRAQLAHMSRKDLEKLRDLLEVARRS
jgi:DNA-binding MarR family transcriptional regulator